MSICVSAPRCAPQQMYLHPLLVVCQWWHWMKQARSESLGADQHWDLVKWSLVTLCSTGEGDPPLTPLTQCLALVQPHTPSPTSILVQCMKWELHQEALLDWVDTAVGVGSKLQLTTVSAHYMRNHVCSNDHLYILRCCGLIHNTSYIIAARKRKTIICLQQCNPLYLHNSGKMSTFWCLVMNEPLRQIF